MSEDLLSLKLKLKTAKFNENLKSGFQVVQQAWKEGKRDGEKFRCMGLSVPPNQNSLLRHMYYLTGSSFEASSVVTAYTVGSTAIIIMVCELPFFI